MGCVSDKDRAKLYMLPTKQTGIDQEQVSNGVSFELKTNDMGKTTRTENQEIRTFDKGAATPLKLRETTTAASFTQEKLLRPVAFSKLVVQVPKGEEDRLRNSKLGESRLRSTGKGEWQIDKGDSKIKLSAIKSAMISQGDQILGSQNGFEGKVLKEFNLDTQLGAKNPIKESIYFDESIGAAEKMREMADPKLVDFHLDAITKLEMPMVKTYVYDRHLSGRIIE